MGVADCSSLGHDAITIGNRHGGEQEHYMDAGLRQQGLGIVSRSIDTVSYTHLTLPTNREV